MVRMDDEGDEVLFNTAKGRKKPPNLRRDPRIVVSVQDRNEPHAHAVFHCKARITDVGSPTRVPTITSTSSPSDF
jgi:hypothetical protein